MRIRVALLVGLAAISASACAATDGGYGVGYASDYNSPYGFNCYNNGYYGYGYGIDNCGWYDGYFYPGFGRFVFDRDHHQHAMNGNQRDYFTRQARGPGGGSRVGLGSSGGVVPPGMPRDGGVGGGFGGTGMGSSRGAGSGGVGIGGSRGGGFGGVGIGGSRGGSFGGGGFGGSRGGGFGGGGFGGSRGGGFGGSHGGGRHG